MAEHRPDHPRVLSGHRDASAVIAAASSHRERPARERIVLSRCPLQNASRTHHEERAQVRIATARDVSEPLFATGGVLARHESEPSRESWRPLAGGMLSRLIQLRGAAKGAA